MVGTDGASGPSINSSNEMNTTTPHPVVSAAQSTVQVPLMPQVGNQNGARAATEAAVAPSQSRVSKL